MIHAKMKRINIFLSRIHKLKTKNETNLKKHLFLYNIQRNDTCQNEKNKYICISNI